MHLFCEQEQSRKKKGGIGAAVHTLCTSVHEEHAIFDEILRDIGEFLEGV